MWPFKRKLKKQLKYQFLCSTCDIFFYENSPNKCKCPICGRSAQINDVWEDKDGRK